MKEFPPHFNSSNISSFSTYLYNRNLSYLRRDIYEHVLKGNKEDPFDVFSRCDLPSLTTIINTLLFQYGVALTIIKPVFAIGDRRYMLQLTW